MLPTPCWARFRRFGDRWFAFSGTPGTSAIDALQLVIDSPEFLGRSDNQSLPRAAMAPPQSHSNRVLVVADEAGGVQLAVCPEPGTDLAAIVGDLLATGRRFWRKGYDALAGPFQDFLGMSLADWIGARVSNGWSADVFRAGLERSLAQGKFPITVVVNELDSGLKETLDYLREINQQVRVLGYSCLTSGGDELVWPKELSEEPAVPGAQPARHEPRFSGPLHNLRAPTRPETAASGENSTAEDAKLTASVRPQSADRPDYGPMALSEATDTQREILGRLVQLDELGLARKGSDYFLAADEPDVAPALLLATAPDRWPFPDPEEVLVVVNTGPARMAGFLNMMPGEIEEYLTSLPRARDKEQQGTLLLRASSVDEAAQIVNELLALKEVTSSRNN